MKIRRLLLSDFRRFEKLELDFGPGLNLIRGHNESGKSTIVNAIVLGLFEKAGAKNARLRAAKRWGAVDGPVVEIQFEQDGEEFRLVKDFDGGKAFLEDLAGESRVDSAKAVESRLAEYIGFDDADHYMRTACVTHDEMVGLGEDRGGAEKLAAMLREVVVGARESDLVENAVKELSREVDDLKRGLDRPVKNQGKLVLVEIEIKKAESERDSRAGEERAVREDGERLAQVERLLAEKAPRLRDLDDVVEKNAGLAALEVRLSEARKRFERAEKVRQASSELDKLAAEIETAYPSFADLSAEAASQLSSGAEAIESKKAARRELEGELARLDSGAISHPRRAGWAAASVGVALIAAGAILGTVQSALYAIIAAGVALLAVGVYMLLKSGGGQTPNKARFLGERVETTDAEIRELSSRNDAMLRSIGFTDLDAFSNAYAAYEARVTGRDRLRVRLEDLREGMSEEQLEEEHGGAALDATALAAQLKDLEPFRLDPEKLSSSSRERAALAGEVGALEKERDSLRYHLERTSIDPEEEIRLEEELARLCGERDRYGRHLRVHTLALEAMQDARRSMLSSAVPVLEEGVGNTLASITDGRYDSVEVAEDNLAISVYSRERGEMIPAGELFATLSQGTVSQLYLAARLKLAELLSGGAGPPLIFDDSFTYFDEERLARLWAILRDTSSNQQVLVLTCSERYDALADESTNIIDI